ncbi:hypothetical protein THASP1DRAFT_27939 [Thamnocephalis sphaerospora]|uniref:PH domain-containing protein n=1 Tax=Thamnocephalis sphaerospora TaxID=78915 RepID=A0A4P9XXA1_9FUNG|nr:hypothetical protein THASP1DRAFT_27939 [Thamnocephalis sphaerospora]|eukprot:RKP10301.1 hypothetical protein THASP1DRAFT_27939 [Thamnocephalis sphaerospora]
MDLHRSSIPFSSVVRANVDKHGWLSKWSSSGLRRGWKKRYAVLKGNHLFYFKAIKDDEPVAGVINLDDYRTVWHDSNCKKSRHCFRLTPAEPRRDGNGKTTCLSRPKECQFFVESGEEMRSWMQMIQRRLPRGEGNILDSVLRRLDYDKYARPRSSSDLRSQSSRDSIASRDAPSLSGTGSSGEETANDVCSLSSGSLPTSSPLLAAADGSRIAGIAERRRMRRATVNTAEVPKLSRRRSSPLMPVSGSLPRSMRLHLEAAPMPEFKQTPSLTTPTFGVTVPMPSSPDVADFESFVSAMRSHLPATNGQTEDALARIEFI